MDDRNVSELLKFTTMHTRLLAFSILENRKVMDSIADLSSWGFKPKEIAWILGKKPEQIRVTLNRLKKKSRRK